MGVTYTGRESDGSGTTPARLKPSSEQKSYHSGRHAIVVDFAIIHYDNGDQTF